MAVYNCEQDFVINEGLYKQDDIIFIAQNVQASRPKNSQLANQNYLYTWNMANNHFTEKGGNQLFQLVNPVQNWDQRLK